VPGWDVLSTAFFQLSDREFDDGVLAVETVGFDGVQVGAVGDEAVMTPAREQCLLGGVGEAGAAHHQAHDATVFVAGPAAFVGGFGVLRVPAEGVVDIGPGLVSNRCDRGCDLVVVGDRDRSGHVVAVEGAEQFP